MKKIVAFLKRKKKLIILGVVLIIFLRLFIFKPPAKLPLQFASVKKEDIQSLVSTSGTLGGDKSADLKFASGGKLISLAVKPGDSIKKGQFIAKLDTTILSITYQQALNTLRDKQAIVDNILDQVKGHSGDETFAQKATRTSAEVARDSAYDNVRATQKALSDATLYSPISGTITAQDNLIPGQNVSSANLIAQVVDFSKSVFTADVDESDISKIQIGQSAEVTLNAYGEKIFKGKVGEILPQTKTTSSGAVVITVKIYITEANLKNINGLNGQTNIIIAEKKNVLTIPQEALTDESFVFVKTQTGVEKRKVETGVQSETSIEISNGLTESDQVVLNPERVDISRR